MLLIKNLIFTLLVPGTVAFLMPFSISRDMPASTGLMAMLGLLLWLFGIIVYCSCVWDFAVWGKGTPAPIDAPKHLVIQRLYRYMRNPMYLGVLSILLGWACLYLQAIMWFYWFFIACCFQLFVVYYEEPRLIQLFGAEYKAYRASVNRWMPNWKDL